uniref:Reverse transcriptase domain-containing protein n=1 Tax=Tanacetum cinerariifolium TaxID=118510 RepID=A0A699GS84_TANCI|nr:hypothetical protein [Tanacetum cinerariifolium]
MAMRGDRPVHGTDPQLRGSKKNSHAHNVKTYDGTGDLEDHVKIFKQKKYIKDPVEIHHIKQRGESQRKPLRNDSNHNAYEMMSVAMDFLWREVAVANQSRKKDPPAWRHHEASHKLNFDKRPDFKNPHKSGRSQDRFTPLIKTPKEILAIETMKFKAPPPMTGPTKSQNKNKFCEFHGDKGHSTDECIYLRKQIEEAVKSGQQSHLIKVLK